MQAKLKKPVATYAQHTYIHLRIETRISFIFYKNFYEAKKTDKIVANTNLFIFNFR